MNDYCKLILPTLETYAGSTGLGDPTLDDSVVADLLTDLRHWCDLQSWNFAALDRRAYNHYLHEQ